ncbi:nucleoside hydrolase [Kaistia dalseonensis]|uniref:Purine nucleosidase/pyrimidine-specific ribonucleoside hydrolase n=1 Tax=Kaistia dalseonensis TaxID=410840 RepID=A0ABU0H477_9HYPH|nr:nucleoside hydrolase [Kaistia dalseonensis]MCX5494008.1 nucleoside hydrolase [Kaistia dalseonensis]MDQ0436585.1 purine nucleosidase/pyrimidine-specific ribonucleoside hydrolase [Kaistia dalseonensis]
MKPILIDCDPGIDDSVAIAFAMGSGKLAIRAITTVSGNLTADRCADNATRVLDRFSAPAIPVAMGPLKPLVRPYPRDPFSHGDDGLGELRLAPSTRAIDPRFAPDLIVETANAEGGDLTILALGPLTNIALATIKDPDLPRKVKELIIIGGAFGFQSEGSTRATGDNPASEWNIYVDPEAADIVFKAGFNLTALGLDVVTHSTIELGATDRKTLEAAATPAAEFLLGVVAFVERRGFKSYCGLIDSLAVAAAIDPAFVTLEDIQVAVETQSSLTLGQTVVDRRDNFRWTHLPTIKAASAVNATRFFELLVPSLCRPSASA